MEAYDRSSQDVCSELKTEPRSGLTSTHAEEILTQVGENRLKAKRKQTVVERFFSQFKDAMILILLAAAAISFYVALQGSDLCVQGQIKYYMDRQKFRTGRPDHSYL